MTRPYPLDSKVAVLIDADNTPCEQIKQILDESARYGRAIIRRAYGDWSKPNLQKWLDVCNDNAIKSVQLNRYTKGKNSTDMGMFVETMDMIHKKEVDTFVLVSSDSDFTHLAIRIREAGFQVVGVGRRTTPVPFVKSCDQFVHLEPLLEDTQANDGKIESIAKSKKSFTEKQMEAQQTGRDLLIRAARQATDESGIVSGAELSAILRRIEPSFNFINYGVRKLSDFVALYPDIIKPTGEKSGQDPLYQVSDKAL